MSFLLVTVPVSLLVAGSLLALVIYAVHSGAFDDWDGPAGRPRSSTESVPDCTSADLIWATVQPGCRWCSSAAAPAT